MRGHQLTDVRVTRVSLVDRGANRAPFKIMKRDAVAKGADMKLNLKGVFKGSATGPVVIAIAAAKSGDQDALKARVEKAGYAVDKPVEGDGAVFYIQPGGPDSMDDVDGIILKFDDELGAIITGVRKEFAPWDEKSVTFGELGNDSGVYPTLSTAMDVLSAKLLTALSDPKNATSLIKGAFDEATQFVSAYAQDLPVKAFKLDRLAVAKGGDPDGDIDDPEAKDGEDKENNSKKKTETVKIETGPLDTATHKGDAATMMTSGSEGTEGTDGGKKGTNGDGKGKKPKDSGTSDPNSAADDGKGSGGTTGNGGVKARKEDDPLVLAVSELTKSVGLMLKAQTATAERLDGIETSIEDVTSKVEAAEGNTNKLKAALKSGLPGLQTGSGDSGSKETVKKSEGLGLIDTGFSRAGLDD